MWLYLHVCVSVHLNMYILDLADPLPISFTKLDLDHFLWKTHHLEVQDSWSHNKMINPHSHLCWNHYFTKNTYISRCLSLFLVSIHPHVRHPWRQRWAAFVSFLSFASFRTSAYLRKPRRSAACSFEIGNKGWYLYGNPTPLPCKSWHLLNGTKIKNMRRKGMFNQLHHLQVACKPEKLHKFSLQLKFALLTTTQTKGRLENLCNCDCCFLLVRSVWKSRDWTKKYPYLYRNIMIKCDTAVPIHPASSFTGGTSTNRWGKWR